MSNHEGDRGQPEAARKLREREAEILDGIVELLGRNRVTEARTYAMKNPDVNASCVEHLGKLLGGNLTLRVTFDKRVKQGERLKWSTNDRAK